MASIIHNSHRKERHCGFITELTSEMFQREMMQYYCSAKNLNQVKVNFLSYLVFRFESSGDHPAMISSSYRIDPQL